MTEHHQIDRQRLVVGDIPCLTNPIKARFQLWLPDLGRSAIGQNKPRFICGSKMKDRTISFAGSADIEAQDHNVALLDFLERTQDVEHSISLKATFPSEVSCGLAKDALNVTRLPY